MRNGAEGPAKTIIAKVFIDKLSNIRYLFGTNWSTGLPTLIGSESKTFTKFFKGVSKIAGPVAVASYLVDIGTDVYKYKGNERWGAMKLTSKGFMATMRIGAALTFMGAPIFVTVIVGAIVGGVIGNLVQNEKVRRYGND